MTKDHDSEPKTGDNPPDEESGEPTEQDTRRLPLTIEKAVRLYQELEELKDVVGEERLAPLLKN